MKKTDSGHMMVPTVDLTPKKMLSQRLKQERVSGKESHHKRYEICLECEHLNKFWKFCNLCGCFMPLKTKLRWAECPDEPARWT